MRPLVLVALLLAACQSTETAAGEPEFQVIPLQHATAPELANQLTSLVGREAAGLDSDPIAAFIADNRTNSLLVRATPANMATVRALVAKLDQPVAGKH
jgi:type II secretory pathway component GspD/PulD (secretin)